MNKRKLIPLILVMVMVMSSLVYGAEKNYLALGDSIAYGYGLSSAEKSYPYIFASKNGLLLNNMAENGLTSQELLDGIKSGIYPIEDADVITVSIGSNDLLQPLINIIADELNLDLSAAGNNVYDVIQARIFEIYDNGNGKKQLEDIFMSLTKKLRSNAELIAAADNFANNNLPAIISEINALNPHAEIYATEIYNPYNGVRINIRLSDTSSAYVDLGEICQPYVERINKAFENEQGYTTINILPYFNTRVLTNATRDIWIDDIKNCTLDPHPDVAGHTVIAMVLSNAYSPDYLYGDADSSGVIDAADSAKILQYTLNQSAVDMTEEELIKSNVDGDNEITATDAAWVLQKVLNSNFEFLLDI